MRPRVPCTCVEEQDVSCGFRWALKSIWGWRGIVWAFSRTTSGWRCGCGGWALTVLASSRRRRRGGSETVSCWIGRYSGGRWRWCGVPGIATRDAGDGEDVALGLSLRWSAGIPRMPEVPSPSSRLEREADESARKWWDGERMTLRLRLSGRGDGTEIGGLGIWSSGAGLEDIITCSCPSESGVRERESCRLSSRRNTTHPVSPYYLPRLPTAHELHSSFLIHDGRPGAQSDLPFRHPHRRRLLRCLRLHLRCPWWSARRHLRPSERCQGRRRQ